MILNEKWLMCPDPEEDPVRDDDGKDPKDN